MENTANRPNVNPIDMSTEWRNLVTKKIPWPNRKNPNSESLFDEDR
jgi:hypothetical protein